MLHVYGVVDHVQEVAIGLQIVLNARETSEWTSYLSITGCCPGHWSCHCRQCRYGRVLMMYNKGRAKKPPWRCIEYPQCEQLHIHPTVLVLNQGQPFRQKIEIAWTTAIRCLSSRHNILAAHIQ
jgi:hypothetical protein